jgi:hypothetical protein
MHHPAHRRPVAEDRANLLTGVAHVKNDRQVEERSDRELSAKGLLLEIRRRAAPGEVHADLAYRDYARITRELRDAGRGLTVPRRGAVRMHADRRTHIVIPPRERHRCRARRDILAGGQDPRDARLSGAIEYIGEIFGEASIGEVRVRVDHGR